MSADLTELVPDDEEVQSLVSWAQYEGWPAQKLEEALRATRWYESRMKVIEDWWDDTGGGISLDRWLGEARKSRSGYVRTR